MKLTKEQAAIVTREISFSLSWNIVPKLIKAFPSCDFKCVCQSNGGVTTDYKITGPKVWVDKIERKYSY